MKTILANLRALCDKERNLGRETTELREKQKKLCAKELLGKCFRIKKHGRGAIKGENYAEYLCFTGIFEGARSETICSLIAMCVGFHKMRYYFEEGVCIAEKSEDVEEWLDMLEEAEQITGVEFKDACDRAYAYISEKARLVKLLGVSDDEDRTARS